MPVKNKDATIVVERASPVRKAKVGAARASETLPDHRPDTKQMLEQIRIRGETLSAEIKQLLARMG